MQFSETQNAYHASFPKSGDAYRAFDSNKHAKPGFVLWQNPHYVEYVDRGQTRDLLKSLSINPEIPFLFDSFHTLTSTGARTFNVPWKDWGGDCYLSVKGLAANTRAQNMEAKEHLNWQINERRNTGWEGTSGKEIVTQATQEVETFETLVRHNPELDWDLNAPIWRPLAVVTGNGGLLASLNDTNFSTNPYNLEQHVVSIRRIPYSINRIEELIHFHNPTASSLLELDELRRRWGCENMEQVFLRASRRLGSAFRMMYKADLQHRQLFSYCDPGYSRLGYGWAATMNFNNIAFDGSIGDLDDTHKIERNSGLDYLFPIEAFGSSLMYLMFVQSVKPELLDNREFLAKYFSSWRLGMGKEYIDEIRENLRFKPYPVRGNTEIVTVGTDLISTYIKWLNSGVDTRPSGTPNQSMTYANYLHHHGKQPFTRSALAVVKAIMKNRELVGI